MPYKIRKIRNKPCYRVYNPVTKRTFAKCSTRKNALSQMRLLRGLQNNVTFRKRVSSKKTRRNIKK